MTDEQRGWQAPQSVPPPGYAPPAPMPAAPAIGAVEAPPKPEQLRLIAGLLILNLTLSVLVTVVSLFARHSIVDYQLDHRHITDPATRVRLRDSYVYAILGRAVGNAAASVVYLFLVRALFRGRRWAYRRVIWLGSVGGLALLLAQATPYPAWVRAEQLTQAIVLGVLVYLITRPPVRAYFAAGLPGRDTRRFRK